MGNSGTFCILQGGRTCSQPPAWRRGVLVGGSYRAETGSGAQRRQQVRPPQLGVWHCKTQGRGFLYLQPGRCV